MMMKDLANNNRYSDILDDTDIKVVVVEAFIIIGSSSLTLWLVGRALLVYANRTRCDEAPPV